MHITIARHVPYSSYSLQFKALNAASLNIALQQETVNKGLYFGELTLGQLAMTVTANDAPVHAVANAETLPHLLSSLSRDEH